jgi:hypothetical protein
MIKLYSFITTKIELLKEAIYKFRIIEHNAMRKYRYCNKCGSEIIIEHTKDWSEYYFSCEKADSSWIIESEKEKKRFLRFFKYIGAKEKIVESLEQKMVDVISLLNELGIDQDKQEEEFEQYVRKSRGLE